MNKRKHSTMSRVRTAMPTKQMNGHSLFMMILLCIIPLVVLFFAFFYLDNKNYLLLIILLLCPLLHFWMMKYHNH